MKDVERATKYTPGDTEPKLASGESFHLLNSVSGNSINSRSALRYQYEKSQLDFARREVESGETASDFVLPGRNEILLPNSESNVLSRGARGIHFSVPETSDYIFFDQYLVAFIANFFWLNFEDMLARFKGCGVNSPRGGVKHAAVLPLSEFLYRLHLLIWLRIVTSSCKSSWRRLGLRCLRRGWVVGRSSRIAFVLWAILCPRTFCL